MAVFSPEKASLKCDRMLQKCELKNGAWSRPSTVTFPVNSLRGASFQTYHLSRGVSYGITIETSTESLRFTHSSSSDSVAIHKLENQINTFLQNPQQRSLEVEQDERLSFFLLSIVITVLGIFLLLPVVCAIILLR